MLGFLWHLESPVHGSLSSIFELEYLSMQLYLGATPKIELFDHDHHAHVEFLESGTNAGSVAQISQLCIFQNFIHHLRVLFVF